MEKDLKNLIYEIRNKKVMLIKDVASLYQIETRTINQSIKRNINKFTEEDYFKLTKEEYNGIKTKSLRSQIVTLNNKNESTRFQSGTLNEEKTPLRSQIVILDEEKNGRGNYSKYLPYVITKNGIITLVDTLKNKNNLEITNEILNAFDENYSLDILPKAQELRGENIISMIYEVRGRRVILDSDIAKLYGYTWGVKALNQAVKRNVERFPKDFYFRLTENEFNILRSQSVTANWKFEKVRSMPYVFTEEGVAMLSTILKTKNAVEISISIMRAFVEMHHFISNNEIVFKNIANINQTLLENKKELKSHSEQIKELFTKFESKEPKEFLYFEGQIYDSYSKIVDIMNKAKNNLIIIDAYADKVVLDIIRNINFNVTLVTREKSLKQIEIEKYQSEYSNLKLIYSNIFHDRFIIIDNREIYHLGTSINHAGNKVFAINKFTDSDMIKTLLSKIKSLNQETI